MNIDQFLAYWSAHNIGIIEALIAAILFAVVFLSYRILFGKKDASGADSAANVDTTQIEKTLQRILDAQTSGAAVAKSTLTSADSAAAMEATANVSEGVAAGPEAAAEITQLKAALQEKTAQVEQLKAQASDGGAAGGAAAPGLSGDEKTALENKIKDLEARLSEYEIISEDIADLSRYKEENIRLQKELDALKGSASGGASAPAPSEAPAPVAAATPAPAPPVVEAVPVAEAKPETAPAAEAPAAEAAPAADSSNVIDDELMKEFAAAVEGQKTGQVSNETDKLMNDFENFVKKG